MILYRVRALVMRSLVNYFAPRARATAKVPRNRSIDEETYPPDTNVTSTIE